MSRAPYRRRFDLRLTDEEREAFARAAEECGVSVSEWMRQLARRAAGLRSVGDEPCTHNRGEDDERGRLLTVVK